MKKSIIRPFSAAICAIAVLAAAPFGSCSVRAETPVTLLFEDKIGMLRRKRTEHGQNLILR